MTGSVLLRDVTDDDLPVLFENQRDLEAIRVAAFPSRDAEAFAAHWAKIRVDPTVIIRTITFNDQVAGSIGSFNRDGRRLVGYWLGRAFWGRGIATRALTEILKLEPTRPLFAQVAKSNLASFRVLEKNGFAIHSETIFDLNGEMVEDWIMALGAS
jgi:RimJ/RimL family protein N-acetyltransferase